MMFLRKFGARHILARTARPIRNTDASSTTLHKKQSCPPAVPEASSYRMIPGKYRLSVGQSQNLERAKAEHFHMEISRPLLDANRSIGN